MKVNFSTCTMEADYMNTCMTMVLLPGKLDNLHQGRPTLAEACVSAYSHGRPRDFFQGWAMRGSEGRKSPSRV